MSNIAKIRQAMLKENISALLLTNETDRQYATGFNSSYGYALILIDGAFFITDTRYIEAATERIKDTAVLESTNEKSGSAILRDILKKSDIKELGVQEESLSYSSYLQLEKELGVSFVPAQKITLSLRRSKDRFEVEHMTTAQRIAEKAFDHVLGLIKEGQTEKEIAAQLEYQMTRNGSEGMAFSTICVSGENSSRPHGVPGGRRIRRGDFITMDFGCTINGYCSDMTRTVALGSANEEMRRVYSTVLDAQLAAIAALRPGVTGSSVDKVARDIITSAGYGDYFGHGLGHSVGLDIHESPNTSPRDNSILPTGAVITCEPGIYIPGRFGVRIEDMLYLGEKGTQNLTKAPKELIIL